MAMPTLIRMVLADPCTTVQLEIGLQVSPLATSPRPRNLLPFLDYP